MTLEKARELIAMHVDPGSGYNRNGAWRIMRDYGQQAIDQLIRDYDLEQKWQIKPGIHFESAFK